MKGPIQDVQVQIRPSKTLTEFICKLKTSEPLPENIIRIREAEGIKHESKEVYDKYIPKKVLSEKQRETLKSISSGEDFNKLFGSTSKLIDVFTVDDEENIENIESELKGDPPTSTKTKLNASKTKPNNKPDFLLNINDIRWIDQILEKHRAANECDDYIHELLVDSEVILPKNQFIPRNPELEARCVKLREQQQEREYRNMTKDVDATRQHLPEDTIAYQIKTINRQLIAVFQFVVSVITGFAFGFIGLEYMLGELDFGFRLFMGVMCALIIALAEIYFLAKKLNEYDEPIEDIPMPARKPRPHQD